MKICVFGLRGFPQIEGGVEKQCEILYPLIGREEDVEIVVFRRKEYVKNREARYENIRFIDLLSTRMRGFETVLHSFLSTLRAIFVRPDVVHIHNIGAALFAPLLKLFSIPVVLTFHSPNYEHAKWGFFARRFLRFCERVALSSSDRVIFVNRFQMEKYSQKIRNKSVYIPNGVHPPKPREAHPFLDEKGVQPGKYILAVGRITPEKGFDTLIRAFREAKIEDCSLVIAGGVEFENDYMQQLLEHSRGLPVVFTGYVGGDILAELYSHAALFVLSSNNEGFPLVLLEAMSYGLDLLTSDIPATRLVKLEEQDYYKSGDHHTLGRKMAEKLRAPRRRTYALSEYDWNRIAGEVYGVFCKAVHDHKRNG